MFAELKSKEDIRMQSMIDNVSDSLLKIYNVFNSNRNNPEVNNIGNYSIFLTFIYYLLKNNLLYSYRLFKFLFSF